ncbi:hypothetical protein ACTVCO_02020 [Sanguibacter sp. A247]|uniref:hypothetical protein n=1 Tax=unclassified Sanguibacter TaxID=2645534 RepID=UPI003FD6F7C5
MTTLEPRTGPRLRGWREHALDLLQHFASLVVAFTVVYLAISGGAILGSGSADDVLGILRMLLVLSGVTLVGHGLVTWVRKRVSIVVSAVVTWLAYVAAMSLLMVGAEGDAFLANVMLSMLVAVPIVALQIVLRAFVPVFQTRAGGERVRPIMSSSSG